MKQNRVPAGSDEIRDVLRACRDLFGWALLFSAGLNLLYLAPSIYMLQIYDRVLQTGGLTTLFFISAILLVALITLVFLDALRQRLMGRVSLRLERLLAPRLLEVALERGGRVGEAQRRPVMRSFDTLRQLATGPAAVAIMDAPWAPIYIGVCFLIHPMIGALALFGGLALLGLAVLNERALRTRLNEASELAPRIYAAQEAEDQIGDTARALGMRGTLRARQLKRRGQLNAVQAETLNDATRYSSLTKLLRQVLQSAALGVGAWLAVERQITPGALIAGSILVARALAPLEQIVGAWRQIGEARHARSVVMQALESVASQHERTSLPAPAGRLALERVSYSIGDRLVVNDVSLAISPGEMVGLIGPSGAGKSSLARIAAGAVAPNAGLVRVDGAAMQDWEMDALGRHIGYVPQEVALVAGTIAENIRRFQPHQGKATDAAVVAAAKAAGAHDMILRLPNGYDTALSVGGSGLSFGQAQRVALARAVFRSPVLLILDEPNAHLDQEGETSLMNVLNAAKTAGAAILCVAHRSGVLALADRLALMRDGRIELIGPRDEVMAHLMNANRTPQVSALRSQEAPS